MQLVLLALSPFVVTGLVLFSMHLEEPAQRLGRSGRTGGTRRPRTPPEV